jgi:hypothetical protein
LTLKRDEPASRELLFDLASDKGMTWLPSAMWFTYLRLDVGARNLDYDLAIAAHPHVLPSVTDVGVTATEAHVVTAPSRRTFWPWIAGTAVALAVWAGFAVHRSRVKARERAGGLYRQF